MKLRLFVLAMLVHAATFAQEALTLEDCIQLALTNNLQIKQAELNLESTESALQSTKGNALPNLNGFASHNYNWGQRIDPFTNQFANTRVQSNSFGLSSSINLFNGFQTHQSIKANQAAYEAAVFDVETQKNNVALSVAAAYLMVLLADELLAVSDRQVDITAQQLERIKKLVAAGSTNIGDQYNLEAQLAQDESTLTQRQNDYRMAMLQLKQAMLLPAEQELVLEKPALEVDPAGNLESANTIYGYAETSMPEIKSAQMSLLQWESQIKAAQSGYYPSLLLSGSIGTGYSGLRTEVVDVIPTGATEIGFTEGGTLVYAPTFDTELQKVGFGTQLSDNFNQFVGLSLNVPIFNRGSVRNSVQQARINRGIADLRLEQERQSLRQRIETARNDATAARDLYRSMEKSAKASSKAFEFAQARYEAGALNVTDFNTAKNNLQIAEAQQSRAKYDFLFKTKVLDFYMGKPLSMTP